MDNSGDLRLKVDKKRCRVSPEFQCGVMELQQYEVIHEQTEQVVIIICPFYEEVMCHNMT